MNATNSLFRNTLRSVLVRLAVPRFALKLAPGALALLAVGALIPSERFGYSLVEKGDSHYSFSALEKNNFLKAVRGHIRGVPQYARGDLDKARVHAFGQMCRLTCSSVDHGVEALASFLAYDAVHREASSSKASRQAISRHLDDMVGLYQASVLLESSFMTDHERSAHEFILAAFESDDRDAIRRIAYEGGAFKGAPGFHGSGPNAVDPSSGKLAGGHSHALVDVQGQYLRDRARKLAMMFADKSAPGQQDCVRGQSTKVALCDLGAAAQRSGVFIVPRQSSGSV